VTQQANPADKPRKESRCPICGKPSGKDTSPFCSRRCADIDLGRWLKGVYAIPARPDEAGEEDGDGGEQGEAGRR